MGFFDEMKEELLENLEEGAAGEDALDAEASISEYQPAASVASPPAASGWSDSDDEVARAGAAAEQETAAEEEHSYVGVQTYNYTNSYSHSAPVDEEEAEDDYSAAYEAEEAEEEEEEMDDPVARLASYYATEPEVVEEKTETAAVHSAEPKEAHDEKPPIDLKADAMRYSYTVITAGTKFVGDVFSSGSLDLQGDLEGNIDILGKLVVAGSVTGDSKAADIYANRAKFIGELHSKGAVVVGHGSVVVGNIIATEASISGAVKGDIDVRGPVVLASTAIIKGNIKSQSVKINTGAKIEGLCQQSYIDVTPTSFFDEIGDAEKAEKRKAVKQ